MSGVRHRRGTPLPCPGERHDDYIEEDMEEARQKYGKPLP